MASTLMVKNAWMPLLDSLHCALNTTSVKMTLAHGRKVLRNERGLNLKSYFSFSVHNIMLGTLWYSRMEDIR